jgi:protein SCO1
MYMSGLVSLGRRSSLHRLWRASVLTASGWMMVACDHQGAHPLVPKAIKFNAVDITGADYAQALSLPDTQGKVRTLAEFQGKVVVLFFGFTQCPEVCPTTMMELVQVRKRLGADANRLQAIFVSLDPERDKPEILAQYVGAMDSSFIALRGSTPETEAMAKHFRVYFRKVPTSDGASYTLDHTAGSYIFDASGKVRLFSRYGSGVDALTADIKALMQEAGPAAVAPAASATDHAQHT